jgi:hypothetical protein
MIQGFIEVGGLLEDRKKMIEQVYKKIDVNNVGAVNREDMMEFGRFMNSKFDEEKLNKLMDQMDLDKDGLISYHEFLAYFAKAIHTAPAPPHGLSSPTLAPRASHRQPSPRAPLIANPRPARRSSPTLAPRARSSRSPSRTRLSARASRGT